MRGGEIVLNGEGRRHQPRSYLPDRVAEGPRHQVKVIGQKFVGVLDFDPVSRDCDLWKILQVAGDDNITVACDCRGENMPVVGVGKLERGNQRFVSGNQASRVAWSMRPRVSSRTARLR